MNDWVLIEKIGSSRKPTIVFTGGASEKNLDDLVRFFEKRDIPLVINHCVSCPTSAYVRQIGVLD